MRFFVRGNVLYVIVVCSRVASVREHVLGEVAEGLLVEGVFKVLKSQRELEDGDVDVGLSRFNGGRYRSASEQRAGSKRKELHVDRREMGDM